MVFATGLVLFTLGLLLYFIAGTRGLNRALGYYNAADVIGGLMFVVGVLLMVGSAAVKIAGGLMP